MKRLLSASAQSHVTASVQSGFNKRTDVLEIVIEVL